MTMSGLLKMMDEILKAKRLETVKIWDALEKARHREKIDQNEFWLLS